MRETLGPWGAGQKLIASRFGLATAVDLTGLITRTNVTVTAIAATGGRVSHDGLSWLLPELGWRLWQGACLAVRLIQALGVKGYLVLDDVLSPQPVARVLALCGWDYDPSLKWHVLSQRLVFVVWSHGWLVILLLLACWQRGPEPARPRLRRRRRVGDRANGVAPSGTLRLRGVAVAR